MIYKNVELHNVAETQSVRGGARLQRVPEEVRKHLTGVWFVLDHAVAANSELQMSGWYLINFAFG